MTVLLSYKLDETGRKIVGSCADDLGVTSDVRAVGRRYPDLWLVDVALHRALERGERSTFERLWETSPANEPLRAAIETADLQTFFRALRLLPSAAIKQAAVAEGDIVPVGYANLHGARNLVAFRPWFPADDGWLEALVTVRSSPLVAERAAALLWLLDQAGAGTYIAPRAASGIGLKEQLEYELPVTLKAWFDPSVAELEMAFIDVGFDLAKQTEVGAWLQKLVFHLFPRHMIDGWRAARPIREEWAKRLTRLDVWLVSAVYKNASGKLPFRPLLLSLGKELQRVAGEFSADADDGSVVEMARWTLAASGAGWLSSLAPDRRLETVRWILKKVRAEPVKNLPFAQTLARERGAFDDASRAAVGEEIEFLARTDIDKFIEPLVLALPVVLGREDVVSAETMHNILLRSGESTSMKEGLRTFGEVAARTGRWTEWTTVINALTEITASAADPAKRKQAALLTLEHVAEARRSPFKTPTVEAAANGVLENMERTSEAFGGDIDVQRELWRLTRGK